MLAPFGSLVAGGGGGAAHAKSVWCRGYGLAAHIARADTLDVPARTLGAWWFLNGWARDDLHPSKASPAEPDIYSPCSVSLHCSNLRVYKGGLGTSIEEFAAGFS